MHIPENISNIGHTIDRSADGISEMSAPSNFLSSDISRGANNCSAGLRIY